MIYKKSDKVNDKLSVIIPVYNTEQYLRQCLDSIIGQTYKNLEIIVVNDCSVDGCNDIMHKYCKKDERIFYVRQKKNLGQGSARNVALKMAQGEWVTFIDSDDWIDKNCYKNVLALMSNYNADLGIFGAKNFDDKSKKKSYNPYFDLLLSFPEKITAENVTKINVPPWCKIFRKKDITENNIFFPNSVLHEDEEFWLKYAARIKPLAVYDKHAYYHYRQRHNSSMTNKSSRKDIPIVLKNIVEYLLENNLFVEYRSASINKIKAHYTDFYFLDKVNQIFFMENMKKLLAIIKLTNEELHFLGFPFLIFFLETEEQINFFYENVKKNIQKEKKRQTIIYFTQKYRLYPILKGIKNILTRIKKYSLKVFK